MGRAPNLPRFSRVEDGIRVEGSPWQAYGRSARCDLYLGGASDEDVVYTFWTLTVSHSRGGGSGSPNWFRAIVSWFANDASTVLVGHCHTLREAVESVVDAADVVPAMRATTPKLGSWNPLRPFTPSWGWTSDSPDEPNFRHAEFRLPRGVGLDFDEGGVPCHSYVASRGDPLSDLRRAVRKLGCSAFYFAGHVYFDTHSTPIDPDDFIARCVVAAGDA